MNVSKRSEAQKADDVTPDEDLHERLQSATQKEQLAGDLQRDRSTNDVSTYFLLLCSAAY